MVRVASTGWAGRPLQVLRGSRDDSDRLSEVAVDSLHKVYGIHIQGAGRSVEVRPALGDCRRRDRIGMLADQGHGERRPQGFR